MVSESLCLLPSAKTFSKTYQSLKHRLAIEQSWDLCHMDVEVNPERQKKFERVLASLSDAQFETFVRILASSPFPRQEVYVGICSLLPRDLQMLQGISAYRLTGQYNPDPIGLSPSELPISQFLSDPKARSGQAQRARPNDWKCLYIPFSINDVEGASDLLLKIAKNMIQSGLDLETTNIELLQRFASLSRIISRQLTRKWAGKWPLEWEGIDEFTLDLRNTCGPDGVFLPNKEWLEFLDRHRFYTPSLFNIRAPNKELEIMAYNAFGILDCSSDF